MDQRTKTCPNCKGKGHVLDGALAACAMLLPPFGWGVLLFGNNNPDSATRTQCDRCDGTGEVRTRL